MVLCRSYLPLIKSKSLTDVGGVCGSEKKLFREPIKNLLAIEMFKKTVCWASRPRAFLISFFCVKSLCIFNSND